jgi:hypothetical protein
LCVDADDKVIDRRTILYPIGSGLTWSNHRKADRPAQGDALRGPSATIGPAIDRQGRARRESNLSSKAYEPRLFTKEIRPKGAGARSPSTRRTNSDAGDSWGKSETPAAIQPSNGEAFSSVRGQRANVGD